MNPFITPPPKWFYVVVVIALIWNLIGALAVGANLLITPEQLARLGSEQQALSDSIPAWSIWASVIAVSSGSLGCLLMLFKKAWAEWVLIISLLALIVQDIGMFVVADAVKYTGLAPLIMQCFVFIIAIVLLLLARKAKRLTWIN